jgi:tetratricopeptide (TPR) repeat protein
VAFKEGNVDQAKHDLQNAVKLDPNYVPALVYLSSIYIADHNYGDTVPLLETAQKLDPNNAEIQLTLGAAYRGVGRLDDAQKAYEKALALAPNDPAPHFNLGVLKGDYRKDYAGGIAEFSQYIAAGGPEKALADQYIKDLQREKELGEKRAAAEVERTRREEERKKKEEQLRLEEEAEKAAAEKAAQDQAAADKAAADQAAADKAAADKAAADKAAADKAAAGPGETDCKNGQDDDADTKIDCADTDCAQDAICMPTPAPGQ